MALSRLSILVVIATIFLPSIAIAKDFVVGDDHGWTTAFDYKAWAADNIFRYPSTSLERDNVFKVNGTAFQSCMVPPESEAGRQWYINCVHCNAGQKLIITAEPDTLSPAPSHVQHVPHFGRWIHKNLLKGFR